MIKFSDRLPDAFSPDCAAAVRIMSVFSAYSQYKIAQFWTQYRSDLHAAVICRMDGDVTVCAAKDADTEELAGFLNAVGYSSVTCNVSLPLGGEKTVTQLVLSGVHGKDGTTPELTDVYNIMSTCFEMPRYDVWYADMSHRIRHGNAAAACNGHSAACAFTAGGSALIVGLCTKPDDRGKGYASDCLDRIVSASGCERSFVLAEAGLVEFYVNHGFTGNGKHYLYNGDV